MRTPLNSPYQTVVAVTVVCMFLNVFFPLNFSLSAEATQYPLKLTITIEKTTYQLKEPVNITLSLTNIGNENVTIQFPRDRDDFIVYDENFIKVYREAENAVYDAAVHPPHIMKPGETGNFKLTWYQSTGWEVVGRVGQPDFKIIHYWAEPGVYYIVGVFISSTYNLTLQTPPIRITIA